MGCCLSIALFVDGVHVNVQDYYTCNLDCVSNKHASIELATSLNLERENSRDVCRMVAWLLVTLKGLRSNNVAFMYVNTVRLQPFNSTYQHSIR